MRENNVKNIWADGGAVINGWLGIANSYSAEVMAHQNFDSVTVDMQHGMVDFQAAVTMLQSISTVDSTPLARVGWNDPSSIMKILDAGAYGVICPMINNKDECEKFVGACRYVPRGYRSVGPARGVLYGGGDYVAKSNDTVVAFAMIETQEAMDNLDAIMSVDGLDAIYVGPNDLSVSLGHAASADPQYPEVLAAMDTILAAAQRNNVMPGIHCGSGDMARRMIDKGYKFTTIMNDARLMSLGADMEIKVARGAN